MAVPKTIVQAAGKTWTGVSRLNLSWLPEEERIRVSDSTMSIQVDAGATFAQISYTWAEDGKTERGEMLVSGSEKTGALTIGWVDSWHQSTSVLLATGAETDDGRVRVVGTYSVPDHPDWGWSIQFESTAEGELVMSMENIDPSGVAEWAVEARYTEVS